MRARFIQALSAGAAAAAVAVVATIVLALLDLYLSGHGVRLLTAPLVEWDAVGVHMSAADVLLLGLTFVAASIGWSVAGRVANR